MFQHETQLVEQTFEQLQKKGVLNHIQSSFISKVTILIQQSNINSLKPFKNVGNSKAEQIASQIVFQYLISKGMTDTLTTANTEFQNYFEERDLSLIESLQIQTNPNKNYLHSLFEFWKNSKESIIQQNKISFRRKLQSMIDKLIDDGNNNESNQNDQTTSKSIQEETEQNEIAIDRNVQLIQENNEIQDPQLPEKPFNLLANSNDYSFNSDYSSKSNSEKSVGSTFLEEEMSSESNLTGNQVKEPRIIKKRRHLRSKQKELDDFFAQAKKGDNENRPQFVSRNQKKNESLTIIPIRSSNSNGYDEATTEFITKVEKKPLPLRNLNSSDKPLNTSSLSFDGFFSESDGASRENVDFDTDENSAVFQLKSPTKRQKMSDSDDFDDFFD